jgi:hypothetical protein
MGDVIDSLLVDARTVLVSIVFLVGIAFVISTWVRTKSVVPTLGAVLVTVVVVWGVTNVNWLQDQVQEDIEQRESDPGSRISGL